MIRLTIFFGLIAGAVLAVGNMSAERLHAAGQALLALAGAHWLTVLPWLLAALFARAWWRQRRRMGLYEQMAADGIETERQLRAEMWERDRAIERAAAARNGKRTTR